MSKKNQNISTELNVLHAVYSSKTFLKVKQWLEGGQMIFSFVNKDTKDFIDVYFSADEMMLFCDKILNETLQKIINDSGYTSPIGGNSTGNNGKPISRYFSITKGSKVPYLFKAVIFPAKESTTGAFIPIQGQKPLKEITVPMNEDNLYLIARKWRYLQDDYYREKYCIKNMKSSYQPNNVEKNTTSSQTAPAEKKEVGITLQEKRVISTTVLKKLDKFPGCFAIKVKTDGKEKQVIFLKENIQKIDVDKWNSFIKLTTQRNNIPFLAIFYEKNESLYFSKFSEV